MTCVYQDGLTSGFDEDVNGSTVEQLQKTVADMVNEEIKAKAVIQDLRTKIQELEKVRGKVKFPFGQNI